MADPNKQGHHGDSSRLPFPHVRASPHKHHDPISSDTSSSSSDNGGGVKLHPKLPAAFNNSSHKTGHDSKSDSKAAGGPDLKGLPRLQAALDHTRVPDRAYASSQQGPGTSNTGLQPPRPQAHQVHHAPAHHAQPHHIQGYRPQAHHHHIQGHPQPPRMAPPPPQAPGLQASQPQAPHLQGPRLPATSPQGQIPHGNRIPNPHLPNPQGSHPGMHPLEAQHRLQVLRQAHAADEQQRQHWTVMADQANYTLAEIAARQAVRRDEFERIIGGKGTVGELYDLYMGP